MNHGYSTKARRDSNPRYVTLSGYPATIPATISTFDFMQR